MIEALPLKLTINYQHNIYFTFKVLKSTWLHLIGNQLSLKVSNSLNLYQQFVTDSSKPNESMNKATCCEIKSQFVECFVGSNLLNPGYKWIAWINNGDVIPAFWASWCRCKRPNELNVNAKYERPIRVAGLTKVLPEIWMLLSFDFAAKAQGKSHGNLRFMKGMV